MSFIKRAFRPLAFAALLALTATGCSPNPVVYYVAFASADLRTCDQACGDGVSFCSLVDHCDDEAVADPDACTLVAPEARAGEVLIECTVRHYASGRL